MINLKRCYVWWYCPLPGLNKEFGYDSWSGLEVATQVLVLLLCQWFDVIFWGYQLPLQKHLIPNRSWLTELIAPGGIDPGVGSGEKIKKNSDSYVWAVRSIASFHTWTWHLYVRTRAKVLDCNRLWSCFWCCIVFVINLWSNHISQRYKDLSTLLSQELCESGIYSCLVGLHIIKWCICFNHSLMGILMC